MTRTPADPTSKSGGLLVVVERPKRADVAGAGQQTAWQRNLGRKVTFNNPQPLPLRTPPMNSIIYLVGLVVIVMAILSFIGMR